MALFNNLSDLLTSIRMDLGIYGLVLPVDVEEAMMDVLKLKTLPTFSVYVPYRFDLKISSKMMQNLSIGQPSYQYSAIRLPVENMFPEQRLLHVLEVKPLTNVAGSGYATPIFNGDVNIYNGLALAQAHADLLSMACPNFTWEFKDPDILYLYNYSSILGGDMIVTLGLEHLPNMRTIKPTTMLTLQELALLDIKNYLYKTIQHHDGLASAFATIELKIDDWREAASKREDLIEKWKDIYHLDMPSYIII